MRIWVLSDLHLEFQPVDLPDLDVDVVVLAGDIDVGEKGVAWARRQFPKTPVVYVIGNHEYYGQNLSTLQGRLRLLGRESNVHVLENESVVIGSLRFLGCTLWSDWALYGDPQGHAEYARKHLRDFFDIRVQDGPDEREFRPADAQDLHAASRRWLSAELRTPSEQETVVITHNAPGKGSIASRFAGNRLTPSFVVDLEDLVEQSGARLWIHGHVHDCFDYRIGETRVVCNPRGYPSENARFDPALIVDL